MSSTPYPKEKDKYYTQRYELGNQKKRKSEEGKHEMKPRLLHLSNNIV